VNQSSIDCFLANKHSMIALMSQKDEISASASGSATASATATASVTGSVTVSAATSAVLLAPLPNGSEKVVVDGGSDMVEGGGTLSGVMLSEKRVSATNTPHGTAVDGATKKSSHPHFGGVTLVNSSGGFPALGSILGPYFCLGRLGKGTFCSIHKCVHLHYYGNDEDDQSNKQSKPRLAAAKVEIGEFRNSGVLGGEATMLQFLDSSLPADTVPVYMGHYRGGEDVSAIVMEYLPGQDMHVIRDWATKYKSRRLSIQDAVYLTANMMLPLLQRMHQVGIVHRDVKPSNCVKRGVRDFLMVDFGLSKSIVVPKDSPLSDPDHPWKGTDWIRPPNHSEEGHYRKERPTADFRGTSMYASARVHQLKDYCPRDDIWGLMYVFCDLVSGGLPWMSHAAVREREACRKLKERIHGEEEGTPEQTYRLLMGHDYHVALFKKFKQGIDLPEGVKEDDGTLPEPLAMSKDAKKVELLRKAFHHLGGLSFWDMPDYDLIKECLEGFLEGEIEDPSITPIDWERLADSTKRKREAAPLFGKNVPTWDLLDEVDPIDSSIFQEAEAAAAGEMPEVNLSGEAADKARLPLELQFRIAQMEYNTLHHSAVPPHLALRDWLKVALPILYGEWDSQKFERGGHRNNGDGYRREFLLKLVDKCLTCSSRFRHFRQLDCIYISTKNGSNAPKKKRKIACTISELSPDSLGSDLLAISQVSFRLRAMKKYEEKISRAPPPRLSFGSSNNVR
jgi:serine/threonine protein kinase